MSPNVESCNQGLQSWHVEKSLHLGLACVSVRHTCSAAHAGLTAPYSRLRAACVQVENRQALENFGGIVAAADAIILSRGNLGLDVPPDKMAMVQKVGCTSLPLPLAEVMSRMDCRC